MAVRVSGEGVLRVAVMSCHAVYNCVTERMADM